MNDVFVSQVGAVLSADIAVPDHEREVQFYSRVLSTGDRPLWREEDLTNNLGMPIVGLGALSPQYASLPLQWMPHIQVANVAASVERAIQHGGTVLIDAEDDNGNSRWAVLLDLNGAAFGIIPVVSAELTPRIDGASTEACHAVGRIYWLDLTVPDAAAARDFYRDIVEWSVQDVAMKDREAAYADYNMLGANGTPAAGICHARGSNKGLPPVWMIYLPVGNLAESLRRVEEEGGRVIKAAQDGRGEYLHAVIQDPAGAYFALVPA